MNRFLITSIIQLIYFTVLLFYIKIDARKQEIKLEIIIERSNNLLNRTIDKIAEISINIENMSKNLSDIDKRLDKLESK